MPDTTSDADRPHQPDEPGRMRFAFYGRDASGERSDVTRARQLAAARELVEPHGRIVAEFYDAAVSGRQPWTNRPDAARLLNAVNSSQGFDAIVVYDLARVARGTEIIDDARAALARAGVALWSVTTNGPIHG